MSPTSIPAGGADQAASPDAQRSVLRAIAESAAASIFVTDEGGRVTYLNPEAERVFGFRPAELVGRVLHDAIHHHRVDGTALPAADCEIARIQASGRPIRDHADVFFRRDGSRVSVSCSSAPLDLAGVRTGTVLVVRDVTAERRAIEELRASDRRKGEFLAMLSHELRNPLTPIRSSLHLLERAAPGSEQAQRAATVLRSQTDHLARLLDDLLDVTRISRGKVDLVRGGLDLCALFRSACGDHQAAFEQRGLTLATAIPGDPVWVDGDGTRLAQVLGNLLQNAAKFTPRGGTVRVALAAGEGRAVLTVRDDGVGMEPGLLLRIFEPFVQAEGGPARTQGGLGLGLSLVRQLVELHGGMVRAESPGPGRGSTFTVSLPLSGAGPAAAPPGAAEAAAPVRGHRVLVVDDNVDAAETLAEVLELEGHEVEVCHGGAEAIARASAAPPDVLLCDIGLPDVDGNGVARALRADPRLARTRLVALTGYTQDEDRTRARQAGFDAFLAKPPALDELLALVAKGPRVE